MFKMKTMYFKNGRQEVKIRQKEELGFVLVYLYSNGFMDDRLEIELSDLDYYVSSLKRRGFKES